MTGQQGTGRAGDAAMTGRQHGAGPARDGGGPARDGAGRRVVLVVHALPPEEATGTPLVAHGYATALAAAGWSVTVLAASADAPPWDRLRVERRPGEEFDRVPLGGVGQPGLMWMVDAPTRPLVVNPRWPGDAGEPAVAVAALLDRLRPDVVHVVDNVHLPLAIPELAHRLGIPVVRSVSCAEDLCGRLNPVSACSGPSGYCEAPLTVDHCTGCVLSTPDEDWRGFTGRGDEVADAGRRARLRRLLLAKRARAVHHFSEVYDRVLFASPGFRAYFEETLPLDPWRVRLVPMGVDLTLAPAGARPAAPGGEPPPLRFLLAGMANPAVKGVGAVVDAFTHPELAGRHDWRLVLAGGRDPAQAGPLPADPRVDWHGPYTPDTLPALLAEADVGLSTSVFETFHRVTREYLAAGLAVIGSGAFGITDVVVPGGNGLRFDHAVDGSLRRAVVTLLDDRALVDRLRAGARATPIRTVAEEVEELQAVYREVIDEKRRTADRLRVSGRTGSAPRAVARRAVGSGNGPGTGSEGGLGAGSEGGPGGGRRGVGTADRR